MTAGPLKLLLVDVPPPSAAACLAALDEAGGAVHAETADDPVAVEAALLRRAWDAVLHGGDEATRVPATKALALVRLADAHLPVVSIDRPLSLADLSAVAGASPDLAVTAPAQLPQRLARELENAGRRRRGGEGARRLLAAQQGVAEHLAAGPESRELLRRVIGTLGERFGFVFGAAWRPDPAVGELRCDVVWQASAADPRIGSFASLSRSWTFTPGRGLPGRVWAFHRPIWLADPVGGGGAARGEFAARAGLVSALGFPVTVDDAVVAVAELWAAERRPPDAEVAVLLGAIGRQVGIALARREREDADRRRLELLLAAAAGRAVG